MESTISVSATSAENPGCPELILIWNGEEIRLPASSDAAFSIGLHQSNNLAVPGIHTSRVHATLRWQRNSFELIDHSSNGTFVQLEDGQITHVHRSLLRLWGKGYLSFGEPLSISSALRFGHA